MLFYFFLYTFLLVSVFHGSSKLTEVSAISDEQTSAAGAVKLSELSQSYWYPQRFRYIKGEPFTILHSLQIFDESYPAR